MNNNNQKLHPDYIAGLMDADGCFAAYASVNDDGKRVITFEAKITQNRTSAAVLYMVAKTLGCGTVVKDHQDPKDQAFKKLKAGKVPKDALKWHVTDPFLLHNIIVPFFEQHVLQSSKLLNFNDFKAALAYVIEARKAQQEPSIAKLQKMLQHINLARPALAKWQFMWHRKFAITGKWLAGFIDGDGCFATSISPERSLNGNVWSVGLRLELPQAKHDLHLLKAILNFLKAGKINPAALGTGPLDFNALPEAGHGKTKRLAVLRCYDELAIKAAFGNATLHTRKQLDYEVWLQLKAMQKAGMNSTLKGVNAMRALQKTMNSKRK